MLLECLLMHCTQQRVNSHPRQPDRLAAARGSHMAGQPPERPGKLLWVERSDMSDVAAVGEGMDAGFAL
jgi:hypothetical protein